MPELRHQLDLSFWLERLFQDSDMALMGHDQRPEDQNLGLGWTYYSLIRLIRPQRAVVIGSFRGFVPLVLARALSDNVEGGEVLFIDPSLVDDFWTDPPAVRRHFEAFGQSNIEHYCSTTQDFILTENYRQLPEVGMVFIDGFHTQEQAKLDFEAFLPKVAPEGVFVFHDSVRERSSGIYGEDRRYTHTVVRFIDELRGDPDFQVFDLVFGDGATLVRRALPASPLP